MDEEIDDLDWQWYVDYEGGIVCEKCWVDMMPTGDRTARNLLAAIAGHRASAHPRANAPLGQPDRPGRVVRVAHMLGCMVGDDGKRYCPTHSPEDLGGEPAGWIPIAPPSA